MKLLSTWHLSIDDEFRDYLNFILTVTAIIILNALALQAYQHYNVKAKLTETYSLVTAYKIFVHEYYGAVNRLPSNEILQSEFLDADNQFAGGSTRIQYADIRFDEGAIIVTFADEHTELDGTSLSFRPVTSENTGTVRWLCGYAQLPGDSEPLVSNSTIPDKFLVSICRE